MHPRQNNISCQSRPFKARNSIKNSWVRQTKKRGRFCCIWPSSNNIFYFTLKTDLVNGRKRCPWVGQSISKTVSFSSAVRLIVVFRSLRPICTANNIASEPLTNINACFLKTDRVHSGDWVKDKTRQQALYLYPETCLMTYFAYCSIY